MIKEYDDSYFEKIKQAVLKAGVEAVKYGKKSMEKYKPGQEDLYTKFITTNSLSKKIIDESYFIIYDEGYMWFDPERTVLDVKLVLKFDNKSDFRTLNEKLEQIAKELNCNEIIVGTCFAKDCEQLSKAYEGLGYTVLEKLLFKTVGG